MAVSLDEVNYLIVRYLRESGFNHTAFVFETESFLSSSNINRYHIPPGALVSILQKSLSYVQLEKAIKHAKKDPNDPIHNEILQIEEKFPEIVPTETDEPQLPTQEVTLHHPFVPNSMPPEPVLVTPMVASILTGHLSNAYSCKWNSTGTQMVTAGSGGIAIMWIVKNGIPVDNYNIQIPFDEQNAERDLSSVDIDPSGKYVALSCFNHYVYLFNTETKEVMTLDGHTKFVYKVLFNSDGTLLLSISLDNTAIVWSLDGKIQHHMKLHTSAILDAAWRGPKLFATAGADSNVGVFDLSAGMTALLKGHTKRVNAVAFSCDGLLASASEDTTVRVWRADGSLHTVLGGHGEHTRDVCMLAWQPRSPRVVASASLDSRVILWDAQEGVKRAVLENHADEVIALAFSPDGALLASGGVDRVVAITRVADSRTLALYEGPSEVLDLQWDPTGTHLTVCYEDSPVAILHLGGLRQ